MQNEYRCRYKLKNEVYIMSLTEEQMKKIAEELLITKERLEKAVKLAEEFADYNNFLEKTLVDYSGRSEAEIKESWRNWKRKNEQKK
jgi:hypothetical protein